MITIKTDGGLHVFRFHINIRFIRPRPTWVGYTAFTHRLCFAPKRALRNDPTETSSELRRTETSQNCKIELQNITLCCSGYRAHPLLFRLVSTTNHGIDRGQADDVPYNPALRYGFSLLIDLVIISGDVGLFTRYQKVSQFYSTGVEGRPRKPCGQAVLKFPSTTKRCLFSAGRSEEANLNHSTF